MHSPKLAVLGGKKSVCTSCLCLSNPQVPNPPNRDHTVALRPPLSATLGTMPSLRLPPDPSRHPVAKYHISKMRPISPNHPYCIDKRKPLVAVFASDLSTNSANCRPNGSQLAVKWHSGRLKRRDYLLMIYRMRLPSGRILLCERGRLYRQPDHPNRSTLIAS